MYAKSYRGPIPRDSLLYMMLLGLAGLLIFAALALGDAAQMYVIRDQDRVLTLRAFSEDPEQILDRAGLNLGAADSYTTEAVDGGAAITISRAQNITIHYHGKVMLVTSPGETAGELLRRLGLEVTGEDVTSHGMDTLTRDGMVLRVDKQVTREEVYTQILPHEVRYYNAPSIPTGMEEVLVRGVDGELQCRALVTYVNGEETNRRVLSETVTLAPVTEVIGQGTGNPPPETQPQEMPVISDGYITLPTGEVLTYYKTDTVRATAYTHTDKGCDLTTSTGTTVHWGTVAVDPRYIPYGTRMFIMASNGSYVYGIATAEDCGGDIKGDRMDLYMPTFEQCMEFGRRRCTLYFLG